MPTNAEETTRPVVCQLVGGPQDGVRHVFGVLPVMLVDVLDGGYYKRKMETTADGAHVFDYHPPSKALCEPAETS